MALGTWEQKKSIGCVRAGGGAVKHHLHSHLISSLILSGLKYARCSNTKRSFPRVITLMVYYNALKMTISDPK